MLVFPTMLVAPAKNAGMPVPEMDSNHEFDANAFPHFAVFCSLQLGCPMEPGEHWTNAEVIAQVPEEEIRTVTVAQLVARGYCSKGLRA